MAVLSAVFSLAEKKPDKQTINATSSGAEINVGTDNIILVVATGACHIALGDTGMGAADTTNLYIPGSSFVQIDTGKRGFVRIYNPGAAAIDVYVQQMVA